jgi:DNA polymerase-3 subunit delta'
MASHRKIAIIDDANRMNAESANALLKTLEEPPSYALLILIATNEHGLLPTIRSRCQQVRFAPLEARHVAELMLELGRTDDSAEANRVAAMSAGSPARASELFDPELRELRAKLYQKLAGDPFDSVTTAQCVLDAIESVGGDTVTQRKTVNWAIGFTTQFFRSVVRDLLDSETIDSIPEATAFAASLKPAAAEDIELCAELIDRTVESERHLEQKISVPLCVESLFDDLGRILRSRATR